MAKFVSIVPVLLLLAGCGRSPSERLSRLSEEFVHTTLSFSPSAATSAGLHAYDGKNLDESLDDISPATLAKQQRFYESVRNRLKNIDPAGLSAEDRADMTILQDQTELALLDFTSIHTSLHNPTSYVETLGNALFTPFSLEYAPLAERFRHIIARLQKVPLYLDQASTNLQDAPAIWTQVAMDENQGNIDLVDKTIRTGAPPDMRDAYARAAAPALKAMQSFQDYLKTRLSARATSSWRMGDAYASKFRHSMESGLEADNMLQAADRDLHQVRAQMLDLALPLHRQIAPGHHDHEELSGDDRQNQVIGEVLAKIAQNHTTAEEFMDAARKDLDEARAFVEQKHLLTLPRHANLQVIPTPAFMRGIYSVGGFNPAPALQPQLGAFYWVTPIPADWPKDAMESKLREYNFYKLKLLTLHEAMPGHYVQFEFANSVQPQSRRLLRSVYGNNAYIEGWAQYAEQTMIEQGFLDHSPEMALTFAKEQLRVIANAILDVRLQMLNMSDADAMDLMEKQTFQEHQEAAAKLQRAKLSSAQLPTYYVGWKAWRNLRDSTQQAQGSHFDLAAFHDRALGEGAVPLHVLGDILKQPAQKP
jgi:uncharacterized protein (DUF885 family)